MTDAATDAFVHSLARRLQPLGPVRPRRMFGGWGLFLDDAMFAIVAAEALYFKVDEDNLGPFEAAGCAPFTYQRAGRPASLSFRAPPAADLDDPEAFLGWARLALPAAERALAKRRKRKRRASP